MKKQTYSSDSWGTPEHEAWRTETYGPGRNHHPVGCKCAECKRLIKWAKKYQAYIAKVGR